ncbi:hypothetical protein KCM76_18785 [Zooshikella marina]|uniref:hypothetical protein n=1 Tax=Zooshikella ganghwensis TaxID=202772 RepID=UPI001BAF4D95|nr:hypothetical protein [Zooshikella ganghwensis]MBU2708047.1 hypothetical protein [Zooshikella ganghwensis]
MDCNTDLMMSFMQTSHISKNSPQFIQATETLQLFDLTQLDLDNLPNTTEIRVSKLIKNIWYLCFSLLCFIFIASLMGFLPSWLGGVIGAFAFLLAITYSDEILPHFSGATHYQRLINQYKKEIDRAKLYIMNYEKEHGYIHFLFPLLEFESKLRTPINLKLLSLSRSKKIMGYLNSAEQITHYKNFIHEAQSALIKMHNQQIPMEQNNEGQEKSTITNEKHHEEGQLSDAS